SSTDISFTLIMRPNLLLDFLRWRLVCACRCFVSHYFPSLAVKHAVVPMVPHKRRCGNWVRKTLCESATVLNHDNLIAVHGVSFRNSLAGGKPVCVATLADKISSM